MDKLPMEGVGGHLQATCTLTGVKLLLRKDLCHRQISDRALHQSNKREFVHLGFFFSC